MIHKIYANDKRFKEINFSEGLNIIKADIDEESGEKDTRNGVGKTTLINIIHFCLGSRLNKKSLPIDKIEDWIFYIEIDINGGKIKAARSIEHPNIIKVEGDTDKLTHVPSVDPENEFLFYNNENWKKLLGIGLFGLEESGSTKYSPSFRSLISYFMRRRRNAYDEPFKHNPQQKPVDWKINTAFLLGLSWARVSESQEIIDKEKALTILNTAIKEGFYSHRGELEAERIQLDNEIKFEKDALSTFKVHPQYKNLEKDANRLTKEIHELSNQIITLNLNLDKYEESISSERLHESLAIEDLYEEAGMLFPEDIKTTLNEAKSFHQTIIRNRKEFLQTEISEIKNRIYNVEDLIKRKTNERAMVLDVLNKYGALEEYTALQRQFSEKVERFSSIKRKIEEINQISDEKKKIKEAKIVLETKLQRDYEDKRPNWERAVTLFNENSVALYNEPGYLIIDVSENGYNFDVDIQRSGSEGIDKMKIFCYDLMLVELYSQYEEIDFLIHDTVIYDSVDTRQRAHALQHAHKKAIENGFQYICALNSDMIPYEHFTNDFDIEKFVCLTLTDKDPSGSLLGFEF